MDGHRADITAEPVADWSSVLPYGQRPPNGPPGTSITGADA